MSTMIFEDALQALKSAGQVAREGWNGKGMSIVIQWPDPGSKMTQPYIYMNTADGGRVPWIASQSDLLAEDWVIVD